MHTKSTCEIDQKYVNLQIFAKVLQLVKVIYNSYTCIGIWSGIVTWANSRKHFKRCIRRSKEVGSDNF